VRIVADHRAAVRGAPAADGPRVGSGLDLGEEPEVPFDVAERLVEQVGDRARQPSVGRHGDRRPGDWPGLKPLEGVGAGPRQQHCVRELVLPLPHLDVPYQERRDGMPRLPDLDGKPRGQRQRAVRDGLVNPARVSLERRPDLR
jgi:hypothetical protein